MLAPSPGPRRGGVAEAESDPVAEAESDSVAESEAESVAESAPVAVLAALRSDCTSSLVLEGPRSSLRATRGGGRLRGGARRGKGQRVSHLGVIGVAPRALAGPVRVRKFGDFQRLVAPVEAGPYLAADAVCHALMNGVEVVTFAPVPSLDERGALVAAAERLAREGVDAIVAPGLVDVEAARKLWEAVAGDEVVLWVDAPDGADVAAVLAHRERLGPGPRVAWPWVPTVTPGLRAQRRLPATCLVAALGLGVTGALRGVHEPPATPSAEALASLEAAGCDVLVARGRRRQIALVRPVRSRARGESGTAGDPVERLLEAALAPLVMGATNGPALWRSLERAGRVALEPLVRAGVYSRAWVRCDADTNADGGRDPVVEVRLTAPDRVREVVLRVSPGGARA